MDLCIVGGSGFVSGTLARVALREGWRVWVITRGQRPIPAGAQAIVADRQDAPGFAAAVASVGVQWDLLVDCIAYEPAHVRQDLTAFAGRAGHLVLISTDFVYDPDRRVFPQRIDNPFFRSGGYGGNKRLCELELIHASPAPFSWTILRPCHIYGPGSLLGCLPLHGRDAQLLDRLRRGATLRLAGGGRFLQQPIFAADLARLILSSHGNPRAAGRLFHAAGPDIVESREYYRLVAEALGVELRVEEVRVEEVLAGHPELRDFLCHRIYDLSGLREAGLTVPGTPLAEGLDTHTRSLLPA